MNAYLSLSPPGALRETLGPMPRNSGHFFRRALWVVLAPVVADAATESGAHGDAALWRARDARLGEPGEWSLHIGAEAGRGRGFGSADPGPTTGIARGDITAGYTVNPHLGLSLRLNVSGVSDASLAGESSVVTGNPQLAVRGSLPLGTFALGAEVAARLISGQQAGTADLGSASGHVIAAGSAQLGMATIVVNAGFIADRVASAFPGAGAAGLGVVQRMALEGGAGNRLVAGLGAGLDFGRVTGFIELSAEPPLGAGSGPTRAALGVKVRPFGTRELEIAAAAEIGVQPFDGTRGLPAPSYALAVALAVRPTARPPRVEQVEVVREVEKPVPTEAARFRVVGRVVDPAGVPLGLARVKVVGDEGSVLQADADGRFKTAPQPQGPVKLQAWAEGYTVAERVVLAAPDAASADIVLARAGEQVPGQVRGTVRGKAGVPVAATINVPAARVSGRSAADGSFRFDVPAGKYEVLISAPGHKTQRRSIAIAPGEAVILNVELSESL